MTRRGELRPRQSERVIPARMSGRKSLLRRWVSGLSFFSHQAPLKETSSRLKPPDIPTVLSAMERLRGLAESNLQLARLAMCRTRSGRLTRPRTTSKWPEIGRLVNHPNPFDSNLPSALTNSRHPVAPRTRGRVSTRERVSIGAEGRDGRGGLTILHVKVSAPHRHIGLYRSSSKSSDKGLALGFSVLSLARLRFVSLLHFQNHVCLLGAYQEYPSTSPSRHHVSGFSIALYVDRSHVNTCG